MAYRLHEAPIFIKRGFEIGKIRPASLSLRIATFIWIFFISAGYFTMTLTRVKGMIALRSRPIYFWFFSLSCYLHLYNLWNCYHLHYRVYDSPCGVSVRHRSTAWLSEFIISRWKPTSLISFWQPWIWSRKTHTRVDELLNVKAIPGAQIHYLQTLIAFR